MYPFPLFNMASRAVTASARKPARFSAATAACSIALTMNA